MLTFVGDVSILGILPKNINARCLVITAFNVVSVELSLGIIEA
jgi:hypothetical protein